MPTTLQIIDEITISLLRAIASSIDMGMKDAPRPLKKDFPLLPPPKRSGR
jgi:hypothetical protein